MPFIDAKKVIGYLRTRDIKKKTRIDKSVEDNDYNKKYVSKY